MTKTRRIVIISIFSCLSVVLDIVKAFIPFLNMPSGGSINISLIPIVLICFILGTKDGIACAVISFLISTIFGLNSIYISPVQYLFDYIIPSVCLGLAALFYKNKNILEMEFGIIFVMLIRTISIIISGTYFWFESTTVAGSSVALIGSIVYNLPYCLLTTIMLLLVIPLLKKVLDKYLV